MSFELPMRAAADEYPVFDGEFAHAQAWSQEHARKLEAGALLTTTDVKGPSTGSDILAVIDIGLASADGHGDMPSLVPTACLLNTSVKQSTLSVGVTPPAFTELISTANALGVDLLPEMFFEHPTIRAMAAAYFRKSPPALSADRAL